MYKELLAATAILLTFAMYVPYIRSIREGRTKPHMFSWITWALNAFVVFLAQLAAHGGSGAWPIGVSGLLTAYIAVLAYRNRTDTSITRTDWVFLAVAIAALLCWLLTSNPLLAVALLTGVGSRIRTHIPICFCSSKQRAHRILLLGCSTQHIDNFRFGTLLVDYSLVPDCKGHRRRNTCCDDRV